MFFFFFQFLYLVINNVYSQSLTDTAAGKLKISGSADVYYKYDFAKTKENSFTSFTQSHNQFNIGMASLKIDYSMAKVSMIADLGFGPRAKDISFNDAGITQAVKQLYISYSPIEKLKFTAGTWGTHIGYEFPDPQLNRNYSMSYMFTNGPFSHTGIKAEYGNGKHGIMLGLSNANDYKFVPTDMLHKKSILAQYSFSPSDAFKLYLNYAGCQNPDTTKAHQYDIAIIGKLSNKFSLGFNGTYSSVKLWNVASHKNLAAKAWWGSALYANYDPTEWFGLSFRSELFNDRNRIKSLSPALQGDNIFSNTLSANFRKAGFTFIPEIRYDHVNKKGLFIDTHQNSSANDVSLIFAAIYCF